MPDGSKPPNVGTSSMAAAFPVILMGLGGRPGHLVVPVSVMRSGSLVDWSREYSTCPRGIDSGG